MEERDINCAYIPHVLTDDRSISVGAFCIITYILSFQGIEKITTQNLIEHFKLHASKNKVLKDIDIAVSSGYLLKELIYVEGLKNQFNYHINLNHTAFTPEIIRLNFGENYGL